MKTKRTRHTNLSTSQCQTEKLVLDLSLSDSIVSESCGPQGFVDVNPSSLETTLSSCFQLVLSSCSPEGCL